MDDDYMSGAFDLAQSLGADTQHHHNNGNEHNGHDSQHQAQNRGEGGMFANSSEAGPSITHHNHAQDHDHERDQERDPPAGSFDTFLTDSLHHNAHDSHDPHNASTSFEHPGSQEMISGEGGNNENENENENDDGFIWDPHSRRPDSRKREFTEDEKKDRVRAQNRKAAEKSRQKKKKELDGVEDVITRMQNENTRLKDRIAAITASRTKGLNGNGVISDNGSTTAASHPSPNIIPPHTSSSSSIIPPPTTRSPEDHLTIDNSYIKKISNELLETKKLSLQAELRKIRSLNPDAPEDILLEERIKLLEQHDISWKALAEKKALEAVLSHMIIEKEGLTSQREELRLELERRRRGSVKRNSIPIGDRKEAGVRNQQNQAAESEEEELRDGESLEQAPPEQDSEDVDMRVQEPPVSVVDLSEPSMDDLGPWVNAAVKSYEQNHEGPSMEHLALLHSET